MTIRTSPFRTSRRTETRERLFAADPSVRIPRDRTSCTLLDTVSIGELLNDLSHRISGEGAITSLVSYIQSRATAVQ